MAHVLCTCPVALMEPKHVILTAHKNPGQVLQLALRLDGATTIWLHVDSRLPLEDWSGVLCLPHVKAVEPRYASRWGTFGVSQALIQCIDAVADSGSAGYTFLVSGQDWPLQRAGDLRLEPQHRHSSWRRACRTNPVDDATGSASSRATNPGRIDVVGVAVGGRQKGVRPSQEPTRAHGVFPIHPVQ